ncbi:MAG: hypothetical protein KAY50_00625 [Chitinophagaceae bacterium]|nr:hypothetical protein [Chitinophagaceae bacterium]
MAKTTKKLTATEHAVEVLKRVLEKQFSYDTEIGSILSPQSTKKRILRNFKLGMRSKAARAKDRKYTSNEPYEKQYAKKRKSAVIKYKTKK